MEATKNNKELVFKKSIVIKAEIEKVWDALVNPEMTKQYMFGCVPVTDWKAGSPVIWRGAADGVDYVIGEVKTFEPPSVLTMTTFSPFGGYEDVPENYLTGEYVLTRENGATTLTMTQGDFATVADGQKRYEEAEGAWEMAMQKLKALLEN